jgi:hypothetical protein
MGHSPDSRRQAAGGLAKVATFSIELLPPIPNCENALGHDVYDERGPVTGALDATG